MWGSINIPKFLDLDRWIASHTDKKENGHNNSTTCHENYFFQWRTRPKRNAALY